MPEMVCIGAQLKCSFGAAPSTLIVPPRHRTTSGVGMAATIMDNKPVVNIPPFGMCRTQTNPAVAAATAAASGTPTPAPCMPVITAPWLPPPAPVAPVLIGGEVALHKGCTCLCTYGGQITINTPNSVGTDVN